MDQNLFLIGFPGTGKSHVGRLLACRYSWKFFDTDDEITRAEGKSITEIFKSGGEKYFRSIEKLVLAWICTHSQVVVSTGGGIVVDSDNRIAMAKSGFVVCLDASPDNILKRLVNADANEQTIRPLLVGPDKLERITDLKGQRQFLYDSADTIVRTDDLDPEQVAEAVVKVWRHGDID